MFQTKKLIYKGLAWNVNEIYFIIGDINIDGGNNIIDILGLIEIILDIPNESYGNLTMPNSNIQTINPKTW